ncbi:MAG: exonuclease subunit SbcD [Methanomicrobiales archaeon]|jgi:exonuclease SbcD|nr:exonuclease subunit SbcD [Methanomicrobiales archaeon]
MRLVHTSDWHLGKSLYDKTRYDEHEAFLHWLSLYLIKEDIDCLVIAGDIFDTTTPSHQALSLYFQFLHKIASQTSISVVIIGGNHDSPSLLNAPDSFLREFQIHVIGAASESHANEVIPIYRRGSRDGELCGLICAVPYLRERDLAALNPCEEGKVREERIKHQLYSHYQEIYAHATLLRQQHSHSLPIIGIGHLFTMGGVAGEGVRSLYLGDICHIGAEQFPPFDYLALGHLHRHQVVSGDNTKQYCGTPIPMGFSEAMNRQYILDVTVTEAMLHVEAVEVPRTVDIVRITGDIDQIKSQIFFHKTSSQKTLAEVIYTGSTLQPRLSKEVRDWVDGSKVSVIRVVDENMYIGNDSIARTLYEGDDEGDESTLFCIQNRLESLNEEYVFSAILEKKGVKYENRGALADVYRQLCTAVHERDLRAGTSIHTKMKGKGGYT